METGALPPAAVLLFAALAAFGLAIYARLARQVFRGHGRVDVSFFEPADLVVSSILAAWFGWIIYGSIGSDQRELDARGMGRGAVVFLLIIIFILAFLQYRGRNLARIFGFSHQRPLSAIGRALGLVCAAIPLVGLASLAGMLIHPGPVRPQEVVTFFIESARTANVRAILELLLYGVVLAPIAEETIFRGYLYAVFKRFVGPGFAVLFSAGLFAAIHLNAASFPGLFVFALCLATAYEATGSLAVPILMHAMFNFANMAFLYVQAASLSAHG